MKTFSCYCGNRLHFENTRCLKCGRRVAFLPDMLRIAALEPTADGSLMALLHPAGNRFYRYCRNETDYQACNWLVPCEDSARYCISCRLNDIVPDLGSSKNRILWQRVEAAKRRLIYSILQLGLPYTGRDKDPAAGLAFRFLEDIEGNANYPGCPGWREPVLTGHRAGLITINLAEADHSTREQVRESMNEEYRTLLGHFRHESGHYFWDQLVRDSDWLTGFRDTFGDERLDYARALERYHADGPPADWQLRYISAYSAAHPWEDWAETWAHYLHMINTLETAEAYGFTTGGPWPQSTSSKQPSLYGMGTGGEDFELLVDYWVGLTNAMNAINLSMGLQEAYPFTLRTVPITKLRFVDALVRCSGTPK